MSKFIYQAKFNLSQEVTDKGFQKVQRDLDMFSDLGEQVTEGVLNRQSKATVKARLSSHKTGLMTLTTERELTADELQQVSQLFNFEINEDGFNDGLATDTETVGDLANYTGVVWNDKNQFKLVNQFVTNK